MNKRKEQKLLRKANIAVAAGVRKFHKYIVRNWFWISVSFGLQELAIDYAYMERGYRAVGGEWFVAPLILLWVEFVRSITAFFM